MLKDFVDSQFWFCAEMWDHGLDFFLDPINNLMIYKYFPSLLTFLKWTFAWGLHLLSSSFLLLFTSQQTPSSLQVNLLCQWTLYCVYYLLLIISLFAEVCVSPKYRKYLKVIDIFYSIWQISLREFTSK